VEVVVEEDEDELVLFVATGEQHFLREKYFRRKKKMGVR